MVAAIGTGDAFSKGRDFGAWLGLVPKQISTGDRTILGSISRRGNRYLRSLFVQAAWVVLVKVGPKTSGTAMGSSRGSRPQESASTTMCWQLRSRTSSPASPGQFSTRGAPSSASRQMRCRPDQLDLRAVLGPVKAWPGSTGSERQDQRDGQPLTAPCARRVCVRRPGRRKRRQGTNKGIGSNDDLIDDAANSVYPPRSARG